MWTLNFAVLDISRCEACNPTENKIWICWGYETEQWREPLGHNNANPQFCQGLDCWDTKLVSSQPGMSRGESREWCWPGPGQRPLNTQPAIASIVKACVTAVGQISWHPDPSSPTSLARHDRGQPGTWGRHVTGNMGPTRGGVTKRDLFTFTGLGTYNYVWFDAKVSMLILFYIWKELSDSVLTGRCTPWHVTRVTHADSQWITMKGKRILDKERLYFKHRSVWVRWADIGSISPAPETGLMASVFRHWVAPSPLIRAESGPWYFHAKIWQKVVDNGWWIGETQEWPDTLDCWDNSVDTELRSVIRFGAGLWLWAPEMLPLRGRDRSTRGRTEMVSGHLSWHVPHTSY